MSDIVLNPTTRQLVGTFVQNPAHGLLLSGKPGVGLMTIARWIASQLDAESVTYEVVPDEKRTIAIDTIRGLYKLTRTHRETALVVIIDDADAMGSPAQNALLKLLEEPVEHVYFILTSHVPQLLLPTIISRTQQIDVLPVPRDLMESAIEPGTVPAKRAQLMFLSPGLPAELARLQADESYFVSQTKLMKDARSFLESDTYARLVLTKEYSADRVVAAEFLSALSSLLTFTLLTKAQPALAKSLEVIEEVRERLQQNAHIKAQLTYLVTSLTTGVTMNN